MIGDPELKSLKKGDIIQVNNPSDLPETNHLEKVEEPFIKAQIITDSQFIGPIMTLCIEKRGVLKNFNFKI